MRFGDEIRASTAGSAVRVAPPTPRRTATRATSPSTSGRSRARHGRDAHKIDEFWEASPDAAQTR